MKNPRQEAKPTIDWDKFNRKMIHTFVKEITWVNKNIETFIAKCNRTQAGNYGQGSRVNDQNMGEKAAVIVTYNWN